MLLTANKLWLISAPSSLVCLSNSVTSAARSLPAKSIKDILKVYKTTQCGFNSISDSTQSLTSCREKKYKSLLYVTQNHEI